MNNRRFVSLLIVVTAITSFLLALAPTGTVQATNPLRADMTYWFIGDFDAQGRFIFWEGELTGDVEGIIRWWGDPLAFRYTGQASHYSSNWELVDSAGIVLLAGEDAGTTTARHGKNSNWRTNGIITTANGDYEEWLGRQTHMSGHFTWTPDGTPKDGDGIFRVN